MKKNYIDIYTITAFEDIDERFGLNGSSRVFGYYTDFELTDKKVRENATDLCEGKYNYIVIERVPEGISQIIDDRWFYKFNNKEGIYEPIEEPECMEHWCNLSIG